MVHWAGDRLKSLGADIEYADIGTQTLPDGSRLALPPVLLGSLYQCLHNLGSVQISVIDVSLQVVDALLYLSERGLVHSSVSSHAVLMVNSTQAKLGMFERMVEEGEDLSPPPDILYPWTSPEILMGHNVALAEGDVYSLCCLLWEMVKMKAPRHPRPRGSVATPSSWTRRPCPCCFSES